MRAARCNAVKPSSFLASTSCCASARILLTALGSRSRVWGGRPRGPAAWPLAPCPPQTHSAWPLRDAWCSKVTPWPVVAVTLMPGTLVRTSTIRSAPAEMAPCSGVFPSASCPRGASGHSATGPWARGAGQGRALTGRLTSQPSSHRTFTTSREPLRTAMCSAVVRAPLRALGRHPAVRSTRAASGWFLAERRGGGRVCRRLPGGPQARPPGPPGPHPRAA